MYEYSYIELIGWLISLIFVTILTIYNKKIFLFDKKITYKIVFVVLAFGLLSVVLSCVLNSLASGRWDKDYIIAFLQLKKVSSWLTRGPIFIGYGLIAWAVVILLLLNNFKKT
jgi:hypothetical protein